MYLAQFKYVEYFTLEICHPYLKPYIMAFALALILQQSVGIMPKRGERPSAFKNTTQKSNTT